MTRSTPIYLALAVVLTALALASAASGTPSSASGHTAHLAAGYAVYSVRDDGTDRRVVTLLAPSLFDSAATVWSVVRSPSQDRVLIVREDGIVIARADGSEAITLSPAGMRIPSSAAAFSPNGRYVAFTATQPGCTQPNCDKLFVVGSDGTGLRLLASTAADPSWSADGKWIAYTGDLPFNGDRGTIYLVHPDGSGVRRVATDSLGVYDPPSFAPSGQSFVYGCTAGTCVTQVGSPRRLISRNLGNFGSGLWSPDGRAIATTQAANGVSHAVLAVIDVARARTRRLTASDINGTIDAPVAWSPDSSKLVFQRSCEYPPPDCRIAVYAINLKNGGKHRLSRDAHVWMDVRWRKNRLTYIAATG
jgi:Tol biopolymer transport system component